MILAIILILLLFGGLGGGYYARGTPYGYGGFGLGGVLLIILIVMLLTGRL